MAKWPQVIFMFIIFPEEAGNVEIEPSFGNGENSEINKIVSNKVKIKKTLPKDSPEILKCGREISGFH